MKIGALAALPTDQLSLQDLLKIRETILKGIDDKNAGAYRSIPLIISGSEVILSNYQKIRDLTERFIRSISNSDNEHPFALATKAHYELVTTHRFLDGNGRTARLLVNLILLQNRYPPALIQTHNRLTYLQSLEQAQLGGSKKDYLDLINEAVDRSLDIYLQAVSG